MLLARRGGGSGFEIASGNARILVVIESLSNSVLIDNSLLYNALALVLPILLFKNETYDAQQVFGL